jgi:DNA-binding NtrC family response regulator
MNDGKFPGTPILHVDDEYSVLTSTKIRLSQKGIDNIEPCLDSRQVIPMLEKQAYSLVLMDLNMPYINGKDLLPQVVEKFPHIPVIVMTGENDTSTIVSCMKKGAFDYITKPIDYDRLTTIIYHALEKKKDQGEIDGYKKALASEGLEKPDIFKDIITENSNIKKIFKFIEVWGALPDPKFPVPVPILITGENGTGKELIARAIHNISKVKGDFVQDNIAGWTETLFEDTLYGHLKGAFSGAHTDRKGRLEEAHNGTLFLDEIGDLQLSLQSSLLRLLQERTYFKLGSDEKKETTARFIFATNQDLNKLRNEMKFRTDLYYRLEKYHIHLPPLRERKEDIPLLLDHFVKKFANAFNKPEPEIPDPLYNILLNYHFPGNIRELQGMVEVAMSLYEKGPLSIEVFVEKIMEKGAEPDYNSQNPFPQNGQVVDHSILFGGDFPTYKKLTAIYTNEALRRTNGDKSKAARLSGLSRTTFARYWKESNSLENDNKINKKD